MPVGQSVPMKPTVKCDRCGLQYPESESNCTHCKDICSEEELRQLIIKKENEYQSRYKLGFILFIISSIIGALLYSL